MIYDIIFIILGIYLVLRGADFLTDGAVAIAERAHIPQIVIGLTIVAGGTSLPELATSIVAARKGSFGLALGNVVGSNVFNIAFVIGTCSSVRPMTVTEIKTIDWAMLLGSCALVWLAGWLDRQFSRREGILLVLCYLCYLLTLLVK